MNSAQAVESLAALAHEHRFGIYRILVKAGLEGSNAGAIATRLKMPPSSLTFHLQHLHHAGLITQQRQSRQLIYAADFDNMTRFVAYLTENCCDGATNVCETICAPAREAKRATAKNSRAALGL